MTPTTEQKRGGAILGWVCLGLGLAVMYWSRWTFIAYVPLLLLALIFSLIAMARSGGLGAMLLLLGTLIGPSVMWIALDGMESDPRSKQAEKDKWPLFDKYFCTSM